MNLVFSDISLTAILAVITHSVSVEVSHYSLTSENLNVTWKWYKIIIIICPIAIA